MNGQVQTTALKSLAYLSVNPWGILNQTVLVHKLRQNEAKARLMHVDGSATVGYGKGILEHISPLRPLPAAWLLPQFFSSPRIIKPA
jgi:hypothetical protein